MNNIKDAIKRCKELIKPEHSNWIGLTNQSAIEIVLGNAKNINEEGKK